MNNIELYNWFSFVDVDNSLDVYCFLKNKNNIKKYKTSDFYKQTKLSIVKAYGVFMLNGALNISKLLQSEVVQQCSNGNWAFLTIWIEDIIKQVDPDVFNNILNYIIEKLDTVDFTNIQKEIEKSLEGFKKIKNFKI